MKLLFAIYLAVLTVPSYGHDHWINGGGYTVPVTAPAYSYTGPTKCCGQNDCKVVNPAGISVRGAAFFLRAFGETIPMSEVFWESRDGQYWRCQDNATSKLKCFFAPQPSS